MISLVVVHFFDGTILKGKTSDFFPNKNVFHLQDKDTGDMHTVDMQKLKAVYFVKDFQGNPDYTEKPDADRAGFGRKIRILFKDGESQCGYTQGYAPNRSGFVVFPCDADSNNERMYVVTAATKEVRFI